MKKLLSVILAIFIAIIPMSINVFAVDTSAENPTIETTVDKDTVEVGDVITLTTKLPSNSKLCVLMYQLTYNPNTLSIVNNSEKLNGAFPTEKLSYKTAGMMRYGGISSDCVSDDCQMLFTIQLEVLKLPCTIDVSILEAYEDNGDNPEIDVTYEYNKCSSKQIKFDDVNVPDEPDVPDNPDEPVYQYSINIKEPSTTTIRHKDGIILHAETEPELPECYRVEWSKNNNKFKTETKDNGQSLQIVSDSNGKTEFTVSLYDKEGNLVDTDTIEMNSKAGFFDKIGSFFRSLFGATKIYEY